MNTISLEQAKYIAGFGYFHLKTCYCVQHLKDQAEGFAYRDDAEKAGNQPCHYCLPESNGG